MTSDSKCLNSSSIFFPPLLWHFLPHLLFHSACLSPHFSHRCYDCVLLINGAPSSFRMIWRAELIIPHQYLTSLMLLWLNAIKSSQQCSHIYCKAFPDAYSLLLSSGLAPLWFQQPDDAGLKASPLLFATVSEADVSARSAAFRYIANGAQWVFFIWRATQTRGGRFSY